MGGNTEPADAGPQLCTVHTTYLLSYCTPPPMNCTRHGGLCRAPREARAPPRAAWPPDVSRRYAAPLWIPRRRRRERRGRPRRRSPLLAMLRRGRARFAARPRPPPPATATASICSGEPGTCVPSSVRARRYCRRSAACTCTRARRPRARRPRRARSARAPAESRVRAHAALAGLRVAGASRARTVTCSGTPTRTRACQPSPLTAHAETRVGPPSKLMSEGCRARASLPRGRSA